MCGIYGQNIPLNPESAIVLSDSLRHRGPDEQNVYIHNELVLYHTRLSIQDVSGGKQPMQMGHLVIVFNGEIYNHLELRNQFRLSCVTRSDTETILKLYEVLGTEMFQYLDGMFALAIYHTISGELILARDRMGEKPLYYYQRDKHFAFSSELNTLASLWPLETDDHAVNEFLIKGWIGPGDTIYRHVKSLLPGCWIKVTLGGKNLRISNEQLWFKPFSDLSINKIRTVNDALIVLENALRISVERRMESSDFPVGCFLSGGIDSGLVTAFAARKTSKLHTFTFRFPGAFDESPVATSVANHFSTDHHTIDIDYGKLADDIDVILPAYGQPFSDDSAIPSWYVAREARRHLVVVLNGDGGDEIFGGYRRYVPSSWPKPVHALLGLASYLLPVLPVPQRKFGYYNFFYRLLRATQHNPINRYLAGSTDLFWDIKDSWSADSVIDVMKWLPNKNTRTSLRWLMKADFDGLLPQVLLPKIDIATMQHALESRTVFFSPELLSLHQILPDDMLIKSGQTKPLLRMLARQMLPAGVHRLPKRGFEPPLHQWLDHQLHDKVHDYLLAPSGVVKKIIGANLIQQLLEKKSKLSPDRRSKLVYTAFALEHWFKHKPLPIQ